MTALERRCRLLLRVYPADYRQGRGEEIIGTLLEATPAGRSWPLPRDVRGLFIGGLRARAALNRRLTTTQNLRTAVTVGAATYLAYSATSDLIYGVIWLTHPPVYGQQPARPQLLAGALVLLAVAVMWAGSRKSVLVTALILAAVAVCLAGYWRSAYGWPIPELACLGALALLAGGDRRPGRGWLWPVALVIASLLVTYLGPAYLWPGGWAPSFLLPLEAIGVISLPWAVIDARPAVTMAVFLLALWLPVGITSLVPYFDLGAVLPVLITIPLAAVAVWRLRRQSARGSAGS